MSDTQSVWYIVEMYASAEALERENYCAPAWLAVLFASVRLLISLMVRAHARLEVWVSNYIGALAASSRPLGSK